MGRQKTHDEFVAEVKNMYGDAYSVIGNYINSKTKIRMRHNICNYEWDVTANSFIIGDSKCPKCAGRHRNTEIVREEISEILGEEYVLISEYKRIDEHVIIKHLKCGHEYKVVPTSIIHQKTRCPLCFGKNKKTTEEYKIIVKTLVGDEYTVLGEYQNNRTHILMRHEICGHEYLVTPGNFINNESRCPQCFGKHQLTTEEFKTRVLNKVGSEYEVIGEYSNINTKVTFRHNICGNEFEMLPNNFVLAGQRCPYCNLQSKGENVINKYLEKLNYNYQREYVDREVTSSTGRVLRFDFALLSDNNVLALIEYDGEQHYRPVTFNGIDVNRAEALHDKTKRHDQIKNTYCQQHNIPLIRIPYWEFDNIESILTEKLSDII
jgi:predicted Zn-ribbon and HTH transcriptional regulator